MATTAGVDDKLLLQIAKKIPDNKFVQVALELNISLEDAQRYHKSNHVNGEISTNGALSMLHAWKENTKEEDQQTDLKHALEEAQLKGVADEFFRRKILPNVTPPMSTAPMSTAPRVYEYHGIREHLEQQYKDPKRFSDGIAQERSFQPVLSRQDGSGRSIYGLENSRYDIFGGKDRRRILVCGKQLHRNTALFHILAYDWATENQSSPIWNQDLVFELEANKFTRGQSIENAIKQQLFSGFHTVDERKIKQILEGMPNEVTILIDGVDWKHIGKYGDNIRNILTGQALPEVTVMVTTTPHSAKQLNKNTPGGYDWINMENA